MKVFCRDSGHLEKISVANLATISTWEQLVKAKDTAWVEYMSGSSEPLSQFCDNSRRTNQSTARYINFLWWQSFIDGRSPGDNLYLDYVIKQSLKQ